MGNPKVTGRAKSIPAGLACGTGVSMLLTLTLSAIMAMLIETEKIQWGNIGYGIGGTLLMAAFFGAHTACKQIKRQKLLVSLLTGTTFYGTLLLLTALFFGSQFNGAGETGLLILAGSGVNGFLSTRERKTKKHPHFSYYSR